MKIEDAKIVNEYTSEVLFAIDEITSRAPFKRSIFNKTNFHKLENEDKKLYFISDTRQMDRNDYIKHDRLDFYNEIHDNNMEMMDEACRLVIAKTLEFVSIQGDNIRNELEPDGLIRNLTPVPIKNLDTLIKECLGSTDKPMITFTYGENNIKEYGGAIVSKDNNFDGIDTYFSAHKYVFSDDLFSIVWQGYIDFSPELLKKLTLYTYPIGEDGITI